MDAVIKSTLALALDIVLGEPPAKAHPVCWMGKTVDLAEKASSLLGDQPAVRRLAGAVTAAGLSVGVYIGAQKALELLPGRLRYVGEVGLLYTTLALRSLGDAANKVDSGLSEDLTTGREMVSHIVSRDTENLNESAIIRAVIESVAENTNDGVAAPLFYGLIGGAPLALTYKMINTLDSMIGYRNKRFRDFGWAAARMDDAAGFIPARLTALATILASKITGGDARGAVSAWGRDARWHRSPNAGVCESVFAGALRVQLGGPGSYDGANIDMPVMGAGLRMPQRADIEKAVNLLYAVTAVIISAAFILRRAAMVAHAKAA